MCGIAGLLFNRALEPDRILNKMVRSLKHRGPDDYGIWVDRACSVGLAHARLSVVDLSQSGHQPMYSASHRYVIAFNGEIYNHREIRAELDSITALSWRGHSDTETLLAGIEAWGLPKTLEKCVGMFAIALWDKRDRTLTLVRDRFGEKPLYYGAVGQYFAFSSELTAFDSVPGFQKAIDRNALSLYLRFSSVPDPYSIYQGIYKLEPGSYVTFDERGALLEKLNYWSMSELIYKAKSSPASASYEESVSQFDKLMSSTIQQQAQSDVPLGAFLSGGVDSSLIVALMQKQSLQKIRTFSIGSDSPTYNEAQHAKEVAAHLSTNHSELYVTDKDALEVIPELATIYDEPFADSSQIPTYLVAKMAKQHVTVALSGDAGDELFGGYNRYTMTNSLWKNLSRVPLPIRRFVAKNIQRLSIEQWNRILAAVLRKKYVNPGYKLHKGAGVLSSRSEDELYLGLLSRVKEPELLLGNACSRDRLLTSLDRSSNVPVGLNAIEKMMYFDSVSYLPWDILTKVDRASMSVSLETRVPFLDHRIADFAWSLPMHYKVRGGVGKSILKDTLYRYVPRELIDRPKMGFGIPMSDWLRGPLRCWAEDLLSEQKLSRDGLFDAVKVRQLWKLMQENRGCWEHHIWSVLVFQSWYDEKVLR